MVMNLVSLFLQGFCEEFYLDRNNDKRIQCRTGLSSDLPIFIPHRLIYLPLALLHTDSDYLLTPRSTRHLLSLFLFIINMTDE